MRGYKGIDPDRVAIDQLYAAFDLLSNDWCRGALRTAPWSRVAVAMVSLIAGLVAMSVLGK